jgi:hypothetical protein
VARPRPPLDGQLGLVLGAVDVPVAPVVDGPYDEPSRPVRRPRARRKAMPLDPCADCGHGRMAHAGNTGTCLAAVADGASVCACMDYVETFGPAREVRQW